MMTLFHIYTHLLLVFGFSQVFSDSLPTCRSSDFHYEYTECDSEGGRWRVSVPKPNVCTGGAPNAPERGKDCSFTCDSGFFLNLQENQTCSPCPAGKYSLGGGARFNDWSNLPNGFRIVSEKFDESWLDFSEDEDEDANCTDSAWHPEGKYIAVSPVECTSSLIYSAVLVKPGRVSFEYQYSDEASIFQFSVQNEQCQSVQDDYSTSSEWPEMTWEGAWHISTLNLKTGLNIMHWKSISVGSSDEQFKGKPILIREIEITGVAFTSECTNCLDGTYSGEQSDQCTLCKRNTFALHGASQCTPCDEKTQYSEAGASACITKRPCTQHDYYIYQTPCDDEKKTSKQYKWIEPQICNSELPGAVALPDPSDPEDCPPCNPGMHFVNGSGCEFCPEGQFSDGNKPCAQCPVLKAPQYGLEYKRWNTLPVNFSTGCFSSTDSDCSTDFGWIPSDSFIKTGFLRDKNSNLLLNMNIPGFINNQPYSQWVDTVFGTLSFVFETSCVGNCEFALISNESGRSMIHKEWRGSHEKHAYMYYIKSSLPLTVTWIFMQSDEVAAHQDSAKIYSIKVTNTVAGGVIGCLTCPRSGNQYGCVPCPDGHYIDENTTECVLCPLNTIITSNSVWGEKSCKACGPGLQADTRGKQCLSDCTFTDATGRKYDFSSLSVPQVVTGKPLFSSSGSQFYRQFNLSLCNIQHKASCQSNISIIEMFFHETNTVSSMICQSTVTPSGKRTGSGASINPVSLGDYLVKLVSNETGLLELYKKAGFAEEGIENDIHFYYESSGVTLACPKGRKTIISLRCDIKEEGNGTIDLPSKTTGATYDGCTFQFMWRTVHACPICREEDYDIIIGECQDGTQTVHYIPPKHCIMRNKLKKTEQKKCTMKFSSFPFPVKIAVPVILVLGILLFSLVVYCWQKNKKLQFKYMKLVENAGGMDEELPAVDSCALEDGEDDMEIRESSGPKFFKRFTRKRKAEENPFEAVRLQEKTPLT